ncbi:MAG: Hsp70 family protein, partial [Burkholderiales bacterium]
EEDFRKRQVIEARNEAESIRMHLEKARKNPAWQQLSADEHKKIAALENALKTANRDDDYKAIRAAVEALNQATTRLAELMMDSAVSSVLKGKTMETADLGEGPTAPHPFAPAEIHSSSASSKSSRGSS